MISSMKLISEAISLPLEIRLQLVVKLLESINPSHKDIDELWAIEAERRVGAIGKGWVQTVPGEEANNCSIKVSARGNSMIRLPFDADKLIEICRQNDVAKLGVFGSMARGEATEQSDIDLLVYFAQRKSLLAMVALERQISAALGRKVDLLTEAALSPYLRDTIKSEMVVIYEAR